MNPGLESATILAVGDELLAGAHPDLNSPRISRTLAEHGVATREVRIVADDEAAIAAAVREACRARSLVLVTGGLGPTLDDVTRHAIARAAGVELVRSEAAARELAAWFRLRDLEIDEANLRQTLFPAGAEIVPNAAGTAPGFRLLLDGAWVVSLPGPPREVEVVLEEEVVPWLVRDALVGEAPACRRFFLFGLPESRFAGLVGAWMARDARPRMGCSAKGGILTITLRAPDASPEARDALQARADAFRERCHAWIFSESTPHLEEVLGRALIEEGIPLAVAESCTGGLVASRLTNVGGISAVFTDGYVTYADEAKTRALGVDPALIEEHGAVSAPVAEAMAAGAARAAGARLALSTTGIAGPGGGTDEKPVGLVWFATFLDGEVRSTSRRFPPRERQWIRALASSTALHLGWRRLREAGFAPSPCTISDALRPDTD